MFFKHERPVVPWPPQLPWFEDEQGVEEPVHGRHLHLHSEAAKVSSHGGRKQPAAGDTGGDDHAVGLGGENGSKSKATRRGWGWAAA